MSRTNNTLILLNELIIKNILKILNMKILKK